MRLALALCLLAGCLIQDPYDDPYYGGGGGGIGSGWGGGGGQVELGCLSDSDCGTSGLVCTRTGECLSASQVRAVRTLWTVKGLEASEASCSRAPSLSITFTSSGGEQFGYTPVPCKAGKHTVDKFPIRFTTVQLARDGDYSGGDTGTFDATSGEAQLDLPY